jgi:hypothetical protein
MSDRSDLKSHGEKTWNTGRMKGKTEKRNGDPKLNVNYIKKEQNGGYLNGRILNHKTSGIADKADQKRRSELRMTVRAAENGERVNLSRRLLPMRMLEVQRHRAGHNIVTLDES